MIRDDIEYRMNHHCRFDEGGDFPGGGMGGRCHRMPDGPDMDGPRCMPRGHGMPRSGHGMPGGPGFGPGDPGMPPHGGPGMPPFGGHSVPGGPRRPNPDFLKRRAEECDAMELIDMAGRMARRLPQGGPAHGQALILSILAGREALSQRELQRMLGIQPGSLSELLSKLEAKGYLTREKAEDRRGNLLRISDAGRAALPEADAVSEDDPLAPLTVEQQDQLSALLRTLVTAWIDRLEPPCDHRPCPRGERPVEV